MTHDAKYPTLALFLIAALIVAGCSEVHIVETDLAPGESAVAAEAALSGGTGGDRAVGDARDADLIPSRRNNGTVTKPFKASFYTDLAGLAPAPERCGDPADNLLLNSQSGGGVGTHLGRFDVEITFCADATDVLDDGILDGDESVPYWDGRGTLTAANGDQLFITIAGAVLPSDHPDFEFEFADPFQITDGTGRFDGASGEGVTNSLVDFQSEPSRTHHEWTGVLVVSPGR